MDAPLTDPLGIGEVEDVSIATRALVFTKHRNIFYGSIALCICTMPLLAYMVWNIYRIDISTGNQFNFKDIFLVLLPVLVPLSVYRYYGSKVQGEFLNQVAASLGFSFSPDAPSESVSGTNFSIGHGQTLTNVMSGTYKHYPARLYDFSYTVGYGRDSYTTTSMVFELTTPAPLPHVLLNIGLDESVPDDVEPVKLEGDFNSYFKLYVTRGAQMEIRELFQPDTMQTFIEQFRDYRMEIFGTKVYLIGESAMTGNRQEFLNICKVMDSIFDTLIPSLKTVSVDTVAAQSIAHAND